MNNEISESLCFTASYAKNVKEEKFTGFVTRKSYGMILTLCFYTMQDNKALAIPVSREEASKWNSSVPEMFDLARDNSPGFFKVSVYDLINREYADMDWNKDGTYDFEPQDISVAAENHLTYDKCDRFGIRYRLRFSQIIGYAPLFFPNLMKRISMTSKSDPVILMNSPGEMLVLEGENAPINAKKYIKTRYPESKGSKSGILVYRYHKKNRVLQDMSTSPSLSSKENKDAHIPAGSVHSAWGNIPLRSDMYEWRNRKDTEITDSKKDFPP